MSNKNKDTLKLHYFSSAFIRQVLPETAPKDSPYERRYDVLVEYMCSNLVDLSVKMISYLRNSSFPAFSLNVSSSLAVKLTVSTVISSSLGTSSAILIVENS